MTRSPAPRRGPSTALTVTDGTAVALLVMAAGFLWLAALAGLGPFAGALIPVALVTPLALLALLVRTGLRLTGRTSMLSRRLLVAAVLAPLSGAAAVPASAALQQWQADREAASVARVLTAEAARCAALSVDQVPEQALTPLPQHRQTALLQDAMGACLTSSGKGQVDRSTGWLLQCEASGCSAYSRHDGAAGPLAFGFAGFLHRALLDAGRPDWERYRYPGDSLTTEVRDVWD